MEVTQLFVYPIKSLGGVAIEESEVLKRGLKYDRRWMIVDENHLFLSQREYAKMALFKVRFDANFLYVKYENDELAIPLHAPMDGPIVQVRVWDDLCEAKEYSREIKRWFSDRLGQAASLVYMPDDSVRPMNQKYAKEGDKVSFADGYPILVVGESSLADLNEKLTEKVDVRRFRPNIVFKGGTPFQEDNFQDFQIGHAAFRGIKPCPRCQVVTINPDDATRGKEPLTTLAKYRTQDNKVMFGLNACWTSTNANRISIGDELRLS